MQIKKLAKTNFREFELIQTTKSEVFGTFEGIGVQNLALGGVDGHTPRLVREAFQSWIENTETFVLEVIFEQRKGKRAALLR